MVALVHACGIRLPADRLRDENLETWNQAAEASGLAPVGSTRRKWPRLGGIRGQGAVLDARRRGEFAQRRNRINARQPVAFQVGETLRSAGACPDAVRELFKGRLPLALITLQRQRGACGYFRVLAAFRAGHRCVFLYCFAKNERDNIEDDELRYWHKVAAAYLQRAPSKLAELIGADELREVICEAKRQGTCP